MKRRIPIFWLFLFVIGFFAYGIHLYHEKLAERTAVPVKAELTVYSDIPVNVLSTLAQQYEMQYHVRIHMLPLTPEQMASRLMRPLADQDGDLVITSRENLQVGVRTHQFRPVVTEGSDEVSDRFKDPDGDWVGVWYDPVIFAQHENFYKKNGQFVTTWHSLAKPGNWGVAMTDFVASSESANLLYHFIEVFGEEEGMDYFVRLKPHVVQYAKLPNTPVRLAALGETDVGIGLYSAGVQYVQRNYPLKIIFPADGTSYQLTGVALLKKSQHAEDAIRFIEWLQSTETAKMLEQRDFYYIYTNPEISKPKDSLGREVVLFDTQGNYSEEGKKNLLDTWISQVRFRKG